MSTIKEIKVPDIGDFSDVEIIEILVKPGDSLKACLLYTSPSPRDVEETRMPSSA